jgi:hypothetical protein
MVMLYVLLFFLSHHPAFAVEIVRDGNGFLIQLDEKQSYIPLRSKHLSSIPSQEKNKFCELLAISNLDSFHHWLGQDQDRMIDQTIVTEYLKSTGVLSQSTSNQCSSSGQDQALLGAETQQNLKIQKEISRLTNKIDTPIDTSKNEHQHENKAVQFDLAVLLAKTASYSPDTFKIGSLKDLNSLESSTKVSPERINRLEHALKVLGHYQFADELSVRELIANSLDSYYSDSSIKNLVKNPDQRKVDVTASSHHSTGIVKIQDEGVGMGLNEIIYYLLTPGRSQNNMILDVSSNKEGVTGRFGQGFISVFSYLKEPGDQVTIETKTQEGSPIRVLLSKKEGRYYVTFQPGKKEKRGTEIRIESNGLLKSKTGKTILEEVQSGVVKKYFQHSKRGNVSLNGARVNGDRSGFHHFNLNNPFSSKETVQVSTSDVPVRDGTGTLSVTVNGVLIKEFPVLGSNVYSDVVIDLPPDTSLTQDRGTLDFENLESKSLIKEIALHAIKTNDFKLLNTLTPLLTDEGFGLIQELSFNLNQPALPDSKMTQDIKSVGLLDSSNKSAPVSVEHVNKQIFDSSELLNQLPSIYTQTHNRVIPFEGGKGKNKKLLRFDDSKDRTLALIDSSIDPTGPLFRELINWIHEEPNKQAISKMFESSPVIRKSAINIYKKQDLEVENNKKAVAHSGANPNFEALNANELREKVKQSFFFKKRYEFDRKNRNYLFNLEYDTLVLPYYMDSDLSPDKIATFLVIRHELFYVLYEVFSQNKEFDLFALDPLEVREVLERIIKKEINSPYPEGVLSEIYYQNPGIEKFPDLLSQYFPDRPQPTQPTLIKKETTQKDLEDLKKFMHSSDVKDITSSFLTYAQKYNPEMWSRDIFNITYPHRRHEEIIVDYDLKNLKKESKSLADLVSMVSEADIKSSDVLLSRLIESKNSKYTLNRLILARQVCLKHNVFDCDLLIEDFLSKVINYLSYLEQSNQDSDLDEKVLKYFSYLNYLNKNYFYNPDLEGIWTIFLEKEILQKTDIKKLDPNFFLLEQVSSGLCMFGISRFEAKGLKKLLFKNCHILLSDLLRQVQSNDVNESQLRKIVESLNSFSILNSEINRYRDLKGINSSLSSRGFGLLTEEDIQPLKTLDNLYSLISKVGVLSADNIEYVFRFIYGDSIQFKTEKHDFYEKVKNFPLSKPLAQNPKVKEVLGDDPVLNKKQILGAMGQHPNSFAWIKELIKNSKEAGAKNIDLSVSKDSEGALNIVLNDDGAGVSKDKMHYFYIPGYSTKSKDSDDINFGWGFFTLFKQFDEVIVESSPDGKVLNQIYLKKEKDEILISESSSSSPQGSSKPGTKISLKTSKQAQPSDPTRYKAKLIQTTQGLNDLKLTFNGQKIQKLKEAQIFSKTLLSEVPLNTHASVQTFQAPQRGLYYNKLYHSNTLNTYEQDFPEFIQKILSHLEVPLVVNLSGNLKQNSNRTAFIEEAHFKAPIQKALQEGGLKAIATELGHRPHEIIARTKLLPYDIFYEFRLGHDFSKEAINWEKNVADNSKNGKLPFDILNEPAKVGAYVSTLPLVHPPQPWGSSLVDLKSAIRSKLQKKGILDALGNFINPEKQTNLDFIEKISQLPEINPLLKLFKNKIAEYRSSAASESSSSFASSSTSEFYDAPVSELVKKGHLNPEKAKQLQLFEDFIRHECKKFLNKDIPVYFYNKKDPSLAHAIPSSNYIGINLFRSLPDLFIEMLKNKKWNKESYLEIMNTVTHEMTHLEEGSEETGTHNQEFYERQQRMLEKFFRFKKEDKELMNQFFAHPEKGFSD